MSLLYSVLFFGLGFILARLAWVGSRLSRRPWWAREGITTFLIVVVVGCVSFGTAYAVDLVVGWERQVFGKADLVAVIGIVMSAVILWVVMGTLSRHPESGTVVAMTHETPGPERPEGGTSAGFAPPLSSRPRKAA